MPFRNKAHVFVLRNKINKIILLNNNWTPSHLCDADSISILQFRKINRISTSKMSQDIARKPTESCTARFERGNSFKMSKIRVATCSVKRRASLPYILSIPWWIPETFMFMQPMCPSRNRLGEERFWTVRVASTWGSMWVLMLRFNPHSARMFHSSAAWYENGLWWDVAHNLQYSVCGDTVLNQLRVSAVFSFLIISVYSVL